MSDEPKGSWTKAVPQWLGIGALSIVFVACLGDGRPVESPFRQAAHRLRAGMSIDEAVAVMEIGPPKIGGGSTTFRDCAWIDEERGEVLWMSFEKHPGNSTKLTQWGVEITNR